MIGVLGYDDLDDAVRIANDSVYGLSAQVYGADVRPRPTWRVGSVPARSTSTPGCSARMRPSGGYKQSGLGRERGPDGIRAFQEVKHMAIGELEMTSYDLDWMISVDDHILEPPNLWVDKVPAKDRDRAPRMVRDGDSSTGSTRTRRCPRRA